jgi:hypothetical protein
MEEIQRGRKVLWIHPCIILVEQDMDDRGGGSRRGGGGSRRGKGGSRH